MNPFLGSKYLTPSIKCRTHPHHIGCNFKDDRGLGSICCTTIYFSSLFSIPTQKKKSHGCSKLRLPLLLGYLNVGGIKLPVSVFFNDSKDIADDLFLPGNKLKLLTSPGPFCVA